MGSSQVPSWTGIVRYSCVPGRHGAEPPHALPPGPHSDLPALWAVPVQKETVGDLTILNAQLRHGGKYTCMAQTVVDSASKEATVLVRGKGAATCIPMP